MPSLEQKSMPSDKQIRELWERCGFRYQDLYPAGKGNWGFTTFPDGHQGSLLKFSVKPHPAIDLNNLFKYAVPEAGHVTLRHIIMIDSMGFPKKDYQEIYDNSNPKAPRYHWYRVEILKGNDIYKKDAKDPALALFWAIWEVIHAKS